MISHVSVGTTREKIAEMVAFYDAIMIPLGCKQQMVVAISSKTDDKDGGGGGDEKDDDKNKDDKNKEEEEVKIDNKVDPTIEYNDSIVAVAYGKYFPQYWVQLPHMHTMPATVGNGVHIAFTCSSQTQVQAVYDAAMANGGTCNGPPGPRIEYSDKYYGAFFIDPFGNKLEACFFDMGLFNFCQIL